MTFVALTTAEIDAKSPIDDSLMGKIKDNFDDLDSRVITAGNSPFVWEINGPLNVIKNYKRSIAFGLVDKQFTPTVCRMMLKRSGISGRLAIDIRKHTRPDTPITQIAHQYTAATQSIARQGSAINTQSIAAVTTAVSTQSITAAKTALTVQSIIQVQGTNLWRYNVNTLLDSDYAVGDSITFASCTTGGNNGTFVIVEVNQSGHPSIVVTNASGAIQTGAAGTATLQCYSYNFTNPVNAEFVAGESAVFASHTAGGNNGTLALYKVNQGGNNVWVKNASGALQASTPGTMAVARWVYTFTGAASTTDYIVGEKAKTAGHTSGANDGSFVITAVNSGGNNVVVYNTAGVAQGGVAGNVNTNRWKYAMPTDPSSDVIAGDTIYFASHTNSLNDGSFTVKQVTSSLIIVYNLSGVAQGGVAGSTFTTKKIIKFTADQSAVYTTSSYIEINGTVSGLYTKTGNRSPFAVVQVNRGGGANYNVVIDTAGVVPSAPAQDSPAGFVAVEMKSIFNTPPSIAASVVSLLPDENLTQVSTDIAATVISAQTPLMLYITSMHLGDPRDLTVSVA